MPSQNQDNHKIEIPSQLTPFKEEKKITIHVTVKGERNLSIRQDSFLMCNLPHRKAFLLFSCNAPIHPETSFGTDQQFTLVFGSLSDECNKFNFIEGKLHPGMLLASDIQRNDDDVYFLTFP